MTNCEYCANEGSPVKCADGRTRTVCPECQAVARFWVAWVSDHLHELAAKKAAA